MHLLTPQPQIPRRENQSNICGYRMSTATPWSAHSAMKLFSLSILHVPANVTES